MSETTIAAVAVAVTMVAQIVLQILARWDDARDRAEAKKNLRETIRAADQATIVKNETRAMAHVVDTVHGLVNGSTRAALLANVALAKRLAALTGSREDAEATAKAEQALKDHEARQNTVDKSV